MIFEFAPKLIKGPLTRLGDFSKTSPCQLSANFAPLRHFLDDVIYESDSIISFFYRIL